MDKINSELNYALKLYNDLDYCQALDFSLKLLNKINEESTSTDIIDRLNFIVAKILFLKGNYQESIKYIKKSSENEQTLLLTAKIFLCFNPQSCKNIYYKLLFYNNNYLPQFIKFCLDDFDLGFLYILSIYHPSLADEINDKLSKFINGWVSETKLPLYNDLLFNTTRFNHLTDIESHQDSFYDFQYANCINSVISNLNETTSNILSFSSDNAVIIIKTFIQFILKNGLNTNVEFKFKPKSAVERIRSIDENKFNRGSRDLFKRKKTIESTSWHSSMPLKFFNSLSKLVSYGDDPKDTFYNLSNKPDSESAPNDYNTEILDIIVAKTFNKSGISGYIAFKLFINILERYKYNNILCTSSDVEIIQSLITLYIQLDKWIKTSISLFSHPQLECVYMEKSNVSNIVESLWNRFYKLDILKFMMVVLKALSLNQMGYPFSLSEIVTVKNLILKNTSSKHILIVTQLNAFVIIVEKWSNLLQNHFFYDGFYHSNTSIFRNDIFYHINQSALFNYFLSTHMPILYLDKLSSSFLNKISRFYGFRTSNHRGIISAYYNKIITCLSHQFKQLAMTKYKNVTSYQLFNITNSILDKSVHYLVTGKSKLKFGLLFLESCMDLLINILFLLVESQLYIFESFNNPNWMNNKEVYSIDDRFGGVPILLICEIIYKLFILVEQFNFNIAGIPDGITGKLNKIISVSGLLIYYELFNLLYIKHNNFLDTNDIEHSHMITTLLSQLIISGLVKSGSLADNLINFIGTSLQVDQVYRELLDDNIELKYSSNCSLSFKWGFYDCSPNLFNYPLSDRIIHLPSYIINICTSLFDTKLINGYCTELKISDSGPFSDYFGSYGKLSGNRDVELDNWISVSFAQTYAVNIYIGIPSPFDKSREKIKKLDKSSSIPFFKMDIISAVMAVHIHRYLNGLDMLSNFTALDECDYIASHDNYTLENRDIITCICDTIDCEISVVGFEKVMFYKSLRSPYLNLLIGTRLDDPILPFEKLLFNLNVKNINELLNLSNNALNALPMSQDAKFARTCLLVKKYFIECACPTDNQHHRTDVSDKHETYDSALKSLNDELHKYLSNNRIADARELSDREEIVLERDFITRRLDKCFLMYIALSLKRDSLLENQLNLCLFYALNVLTLLSANGNVPVKGPSISNPNYVSSILNTIKRIKWNADNILKSYDTLTAISSLLLVSKLLNRVYSNISIDSIIKLSMSLYIKTLEIACKVTLFNDDCVVWDKSDAKYLMDVASVLCGKHGDEYFILQYCFCKCLKQMIKRQSVETDNFGDIIKTIITNNDKYTNVANYISINLIKNNHPIVKTLSVNNILQSISSSYNILIDFDLFGYGIIKNTAQNNSNELNHSINSLNVTCSLLGNYVDAVLDNLKEELIKHVKEFATIIRDYTNGINCDNQSLSNPLSKSTVSLGKGKWIVTGFYSVDSLDNINLTIESIIAILNKIGKRQLCVSDNDMLPAVINKITVKLGSMVDKCPDTLSLFLTYSHFLTKRDCLNLLELLESCGGNESMFSRYDIGTATIDVKLLKNLKALLAAFGRINNLNKLDSFETLNQIFINGCQKILYCQPPADTINSETALSNGFVQIEIRKGVTVFASDRWATQQRIGSYRQAASALTSATTSPHTL